MIDDSEWKDESIGIISNEIENAQEIKSENIEYEQIKSNFVRESNRLITYNCESNEILNVNEEVLPLSENFYLSHQQANLLRDELPNLENPIHPTKILTLNYPHFNHSSTNSNPIDKFSYDSLMSSFIDMDTYLNNLEDNLHHEQHLPIIDQISHSYMISNIEQNQRKNCQLSHEWHKRPFDCSSPPSFSSSFIQSHDEQLVEQWTVETDIDTIQHHEATRRRQGIQLTSKTKYPNVLLNTSTNNILHSNICPNEDKSHNSATGHNYIIDNKATPLSQTNNYYTDLVDNDNNTIIISLTTTKNSVQSSSITNTTLSSSPVTVYSTSTIPLIYLLDALATEQNQINNVTKNFLLTIGFGLNEVNNTMTEVTNTVSTTGRIQTAKRINNRSFEYVNKLPTIIHNEEERNLPQIPQKLNYAVENQLENSETAQIIPPHRLKYGQELLNETHGPLKSSIEPPSMNLPIVNQIYSYEMSFHSTFPLFYPPDNLPKVLPYEIHSDDLILPDEYKVKQEKVLTFVQTLDLFDNEEHVKSITSNIDQPTYVDHYHVQSLFPFPEPCYANIFQPSIQTKSEDDFLNLFSRKFIMDEVKYNKINACKIRFLFSNGR